MKKTILFAILSAALLSLALSSCSLFGVPAQTPIISPSAGTYSSIPMITMECATVEAGIRYTLDGTTPTRSSTLYSEPFALTASCAIQAIAFGPGMAPSEVAAAEYTLDVTTASTPIFSPDPENSLNAQTVTITCPMPGASVYYTTNETDPDEQSTLYTTPLAITSTTTIRARAYISGFDPSVVAEAHYAFALPIAGYPQFSPAHPYTGAATNVTITSSTQDAEIWYTTDGSMPSNGAPSIRYTGTIPVNTAMVIQARCYKAGYTPSHVLSANYNIGAGSVAPAPVFTPRPGTFSNAQTVTISCNPSGPTIQYSINGGGYSNYTGPVTISSASTLRAQASGGGYSVASAITEGVYSFQVAQPTVSPDVLSFYRSGTAYLSCATTGASIYYTTDGSTPTEASTPYNAATGIPITSFFTLRAQAFRSGMTRSWIQQRYCGVHDGGIASGMRFSIAFNTRGQVFTWGLNDHGQLGDGTTVSRLTPAQVNGIPSARAVSASEYCSYVLGTDGTIWAWGYNSSGEVGDGTARERRTPVRVQGISTAVAISAGGNACYALLADGTVMAWGMNTYGQLGDGSNTTRYSPVRVQGGTSAVAVAGGYTHFLVLLSNGTVMASGSNFFGELGDGTKTSRNTLVQVAGLTNVIGIAANQTQAFAITSDHKLWMWGNNVLYTYEAFGSFTNATAITGGTSEFYTVLSGTAPNGECYSYNNGDGSGDGWVNLPNVVAIGAGPASIHFFAILSDGTVWAWGDNANGQLGDGATTNHGRSDPVQVYRLDLW